MNNFTKLNIKDIAIEQAHGGSGSRQVLVKPEHVSSGYLEVITKGFLKPGHVFDWHVHQDTDEIFIVLKGQGKFYCENEVVDYKEKVTNEFYFIRIKAK